MNKADNFMKKVIISHRANISGPNTAPNAENHPKSIQYALSLDFDVEIDVWYKNNKFYLGHDKPEHTVHESFLYNDRLWVHAKNIDAFLKLRDNPLIHLFSHDEDDYVLTSTKFAWHHPKALSKLTKYSIAVMPERSENWDLTNCYGICTDYPLEYKKDINFHPVNKPPAIQEGIITNLEESNAKIRLPIINND